jgi:hypothetical protein
VVALVDNNSVRKEMRKRSATPGSQPPTRASIGRSRRCALGITGFGIHMPLPSSSTLSFPPRDVPALFGSRAVERHNSSVERTASAVALSC